MINDEFIINNEVLKKTEGCLNEISEDLNKCPFWKTVTKQPVPFVDYNPSMYSLGEPNFDELEILKNVDIQSSVNLSDGSVLEIELTIKHIRRL